MAKNFLSLNGVCMLLKESAPGAYTPESVLKARELAEDYVKRLGVTSRKLAENGGRKRVTEEEVKLAAELKS